MKKHVVPKSFLTYSPCKGGIPKAKCLLVIASIRGVNSPKSELSTISSSRAYMLESTQRPTLLLYFGTSICLYGRLFLDLGGEFGSNKEWDAVMYG